MRAPNEFKEQRGCIEYRETRKVETDTHTIETMVFRSNFAACHWAIKYGDGPNIVAYEVVGNRVHITTKLIPHEL